MFDQFKFATPLDSEFNIPCPPLCFSIFDELQPLTKFKKNSIFYVKSWSYNTNSMVKQRTTGKVWFIFSRRLLLAMTKFSFQEEDWVLGYDFMKF